MLVSVAIFSWVLSVSFKKILLTSVGRIVFAANNPGAERKRWAHTHRSLCWIFLNKEPSWFSFSEFSPPIPCLASQDEAGCLGSINWLSSYQYPLSWGSWYRYLKFLKLPTVLWPKSPWFLFMSPLDKSLEFGLLYLVTLVTIHPYLIAQKNLVGMP